MLSLNRFNNKNKNIKIYNATNESFEAYVTNKIIKYYVENNGCIIYGIIFTYEYVMTEGLSKC